jgi:hypothetical protein
MNRWLDEWMDDDTDDDDAMKIVHSWTQNGWKDESAASPPARLTARADGKADGKAPREMRSVGPVHGVVGEWRKVDQRCTDGFPMLVLMLMLLPILMLMLMIIYFILFHFH